MTDRAWLYRDDGGERGPITQGDLAALVRAGQVTAATELRREDDPDGSWAAASVRAPELFDPPPSPKADPARGAWTDKSPHPWRRYFARSIDNLVVGGLTWMVFGVVTYSVAPTTADSLFGLLRRPGGQVLDVMFTLIAAIPGNALLIGLTGLSLGKWIFGVRVLKAGKPIGFAAALRRELDIWVRGLAFGIPFLSLLPLWLTYRRLADKRITVWDQSQALTVVYRRETTLNTVLMWAAAAAWLLIMIALRAASAG